MYRARKREVQTKPGWKSLHRVKQEGGKKVGERDLGSVLEERPRERQRENGQLRERERGGKHRWRRHYILAGSSFGCQFLGCTRLRVYLYSTNDIFVTLSKPGRNWQSLWDREETACCSFFFKSRTLESKDNYCLLEISSSGSIFFLFFSSCWIFQRRFTLHIEDFSRHWHLSRYSELFLGCFSLCTSIQGWHILRRGSWRRWGGCTREEIPRWRS